MTKLIIGVDIGGTKIATGAITAGGKLVKSVVLPTLADEGIDVSLGQVFNSISALLASEDIKMSAVKGIGVCAPGPLDPVKGVVHNPPNLPGWKEVQLASIIKKKFRINTRLENDANAAGIAEMVWGAARGYKNIFYVTVSTGIGTGIIIDGRIYHGKNGMAGEGGHVTINYDDTDGACGCGHTGCIEALASGPHTVRRFKNKLKREPRLKTRVMDIARGDAEAITMRMIAEAAGLGDELAVSAIKEEGRLLGIWLGGMINLLDPEIIVIGGGVSMIGNLIFKEIRLAAKENTINIFAAKTPIVQARLKRNVGIFGAASIFMA